MAISFIKQKGEQPIARGITLQAVVTEGGAAALQKDLQRILGIVSTGEITKLANLLDSPEMGPFLRERLNSL